MNLPTHKRPHNSHRHYIARPGGRAMWCLLQVFWRTLAVLFRDCIVIILPRLANARYNDRIITLKQRYDDVWLHYDVVVPWCACLTQEELSRSGQYFADGIFNFHIHFLIWTIFILIHISQQYINHNLNTWWPSLRTHISVTRVRELTHWGLNEMADILQSEFIGFFYELINT